MDFDRCVRDTKLFREPFLEFLGRQGMVGIDNKDRGSIAGSNIPYMKVDDAHAVSVDRFAHRVQNLIRRLAINQNPTCALQETPRPSGNQKPANDAHCRVHPLETSVFSSEQGDDRENRR